MMPSSMAIVAAGAFGAGPYVAASSIDFDGSNDYVGMTATLVGGNWTDGFARAVSVWVKTTDATYGDWILSRADIDAGDYEFGMQLLFGQLAIWCGGGISYGPTINDGAWHHIMCAVYDDGGTPTLGVWVDGALEYTTTAIYAVSTTADWLAGAVTDGAGFANHLTARITNVTLWTGSDFGDYEVGLLYNGGTPNDPTTHPLAGSLAHWWKFGDGDTYPTLLDEGPVPGYDATMVNMDAGDIVADAP